MTLVHSVYKALRSTQAGTKGHQPGLRETAPPASQGGRPPEEPALHCELGLRGPWGSTILLSELPSLWSQQMLHGLEDALIPETSRMGIKTLGMWRKEWAGKCILMNVCSDLVCCLQDFILKMKFKTHVGGLMNWKCLPRGCSEGGKQLN